MLGSTHTQGQAYAGKYGKIRWLEGLTCLADQSMVQTESMLEDDIKEVNG